MQQLGSFAPDESPRTISLLLEAAVQALVEEAGCWETRTTCRHPTFEPNSVRKACRTIDFLGHCLAQLKREQGVGSSHIQELLAPLRQRGLHPPTSSRATIAQWVSAELVVARRSLRDALQLMRSERQAGEKTGCLNCGKIGRRCSIAGLNGLGGERHGEGVLGGPCVADACRCGCGGKLGCVRALSFLSARSSLHLPA